MSRPTTSTPSRWPGWSGICKQYKGTVIAVTHDRYFLDNVAGWILELDRGFGIPWRGNYSSWLEQKQERLRREEKADSKRHSHAGARAGMDPHVARARQAKGKARVNAYENCSARRPSSRREEMQIYIPPGPRLGDVVIEFNGVSQGVRRPAAVRGPHFRDAAGRHRRRDRPQRRRQDDAAPAHRRPGTARRRTIRIGQTVKLGYVDQSRDTLEPRQERCGRRSRGGAKR